MNTNQILSLVRWGLTTGGTYLVATGKISAPDLTTIVGGLTSIAAVSWSMFTHK